MCFPVFFFYIFHIFHIFAHFQNSFFSHVFSNAFSKCIFHIFSHFQLIIVFRLVAGNGHLKIRHPHGIHPPVLYTFVIAIFRYSSETPMQYGENFSGFG